MKRLANLNASLQEGLAGADRLFQILDRPPKIANATGALPLKIKGGEIALQNINFSYTSEHRALSNLDLTVPAGKTTALVGISGAGKSTVLNLIPRFYEVDAGNILIDGINIKDVTLKSLRESIALVSQEVTLFDDTIRANIAYGRPSATDEEIGEAAKNAAAHEFILDMPYPEVNANGFPSLEQF